MHEVATTMLQVAALTPPACECDTVSATGMWTAPAATGRASIRSGDDFGGSDSSCHSAWTTRVLRLHRRPVCSIGRLCQPASADSRRHSGDFFGGYDSCPSGRVDSTCWLHTIQQAGGTRRRHPRPGSASLPAPTPVAIRATSSSTTPSATATSTSAAPSGARTTVPSARLPGSALR